MYQTLESRSGTSITFMTMFLTAASIAYANMPNDVIKIDESIVKHQSHGNSYGITAFTNNRQASFYNGLVQTDTSYMEPVQIVEHAIQQINTLSFMQVDEEIDREIDKYFAGKRAKKVKKILHRRQA